MNYIILNPSDDKYLQRKTLRTSSFYHWCGVFSPFLFSPILQPKSFFWLEFCWNHFTNGTLFTDKNLEKKRQKSNFVWNMGIKLVFKFIWCIEHVQSKMMSKKKQKLANVHCIFCTTEKKTHQTIIVNASQNKRYYKREKRSKTNRLSLV